MKAGATFSVTDHVLEEGHVPGFRYQIGTGEVDGQTFEIAMAINGAAIWLSGEFGDRAIGVEDLVRAWLAAAGVLTEAVPS
jgi:hypothetical protein